MILSLRNVWQTNCKIVSIPFTCSLWLSNTGEGVPSTERTKAVRESQLVTPTLSKCRLFHATVSEIKVPNVMCSS